MEVITNITGVLFSFSFLSCLLLFICSRLKLNKYISYLSISSSLLFLFLGPEKLSPDGIRYYTNYQIIYHDVFSYNILAGSFSDGFQTIVLSSKEGFSFLNAVVSRLLFLPPNYLSYSTSRIILNLLIIFLYLLLSSNLLSRLESISLSSSRKILSISLLFLTINPLFVFSLMRGTKEGFLVAPLVFLLLLNKFIFFKIKKLNIQFSMLNLTVLFIIIVAYCALLKAQSLSLLLFSPFLIILCLCMVSFFSLFNSISSKRLPSLVKSKISIRNLRYVFYFFVLYLLIYMCVDFFALYILKATGKSNIFVAFQFFKSPQSAFEILSNSARYSTPTLKLLQASFGPVNLIFNAFVLSVPVFIVFKAFSFSKMISRFHESDQYFVILSLRFIQTCFACGCLALVASLALTNSESGIRTLIPAFSLFIYCLILLYELSLLSFDSNFKKVL